MKRLLTTAAMLAILLTAQSHECMAQMNPPKVPVPGPPAAVFNRKESVLDRLKAHEGEKTRETLAAIFTRFDPSFSQVPSIVLSDGSTTARVTLRVPHRKDDLPKFSISGGHCVTAKMTDGGVWILDILPDRGSMSTSVTVLSGGNMVEYPLTVAPPLNLLDPAKADFIEIEYAVFANELAEARTAQGR